MPLFDPLNVVSLVLSSVTPLFMAVAVLLVIQPLTSVGSAVLVEIDPLPLGLVVDPLSLIDVSAGLDESAHSVGHIALPVALVEGALFPNLAADATALIVLPLAVVDDPVFQLAGRSGFVGESLGEGELAQP